MPTHQSARARQFHVSFRAVGYGVGKVGVLAYFGRDAASSSRSLGACLGPHMPLTRLQLAEGLESQGLETPALAGCSSCFFCDGLADTDDVEWLCLCTTEVQRAHRACCVQPRRHGRLAVERRCPACGLTNQHGRLHAARQRARVVIVGGGPAGLAAAHLLRKSGMQPQVLEARQRLGGRISTVRMGESPIDLGAAYIHGCDATYNTVYRLASSLGITVDQRSGGYSGGWGVDAPWYDSASGRRISKVRGHARRSLAPSGASLPALAHFLRLTSGLLHLSATRRPWSSAYLPRS